MRLNLKVLWGGCLTRPDWAGKMPIPQLGSPTSKSQSDRSGFIRLKLSLIQLDFIPFGEQEEQLSSLPRNKFLKICLSLMQKLLSAVNSFGQGRN